MIVTMFPEPREQAKAIGVYAFVASAGGSIGLLVGGVLTQAINWHWIFFVNVPIGDRHRDRSLPPAARRTRASASASGADVLGAVLDHRRADAAVYTIVKPAAEDGWGAGPHARPSAPSSLALLVAFVAREATARTPLDPAADLPLAQRRGREPDPGAVSVAGMFGMFFLGALYLQRVLGYDALQIGLAFLPVDAGHGRAVAALRRAAGHALRRRADARPGPRADRRRAAAVRAARRSTAATSIDVLPVMVLLGAGAGGLLPRADDAGDVRRDAEDAGLASGLVNTTAQVGGALGLAVLATLVGAETEDAAAPPASSRPPR